MNKQTTLHAVPSLIEQQIQLAIFKLSANNSSILTETLIQYLLQNIRISREEIQKEVNRIASQIEAYGVLIGMFLALANKQLNFDELSNLANKHVETFINETYEEYKALTVVKEKLYEGVGRGYERIISI